MKKVRIAFDKEEVFDFSYIAIVIDLFRFSSTIACLIKSGKKDIKVFASKEEALLYYRNNPAAEFFSEIDIENIQKFDNSPFQALNESHPLKPAIVVTNSGSKAVMACRRAKEVLIAGFHNLPQTLSYLNQSKEDILIVPACIFYNRNHVEDFIAAEAFHKSIIENSVDEEMIFDIHKSGRILELMNLRPKTAKKDLEIIMNIGNLNVLPYALINSTNAVVFNAIEGGK